MSLLRITRGDNALFSMNIVNYVGDALDITGAEIWFTAKYGPNDADEDAVFQKTIGNGIDIVDAPLGEINIVLDPEDTDSLLDTNKLRFDVQIKDASDKVYTIESGTLIVDYDVTRTTG